MASISDQGRISALGLPLSTGEGWRSLLGEGRVVYDYFIFL